MGPLHRLRQLIEGRAAPHLCKNPLRPQPPPHAGDGIGERHVDLSGPLYSAQLLGFRQAVIQPSVHRVETEKVRGSLQDRLAVPPPGAL